MPTTRKLEKTSEPNIYRRGNRYVVQYRDPQGRRCKKAAATMAEARDIRASVRTDISRGEYLPQTKLTLQAYYDEWVKTYTGRTKKRISASTLDRYKEQMKLHVLPALGRMRLADIGPSRVKTLAADLSAKGLSPSSVRLTIAPLKVLLATAFEDELIRRNPAANVRIAQPSKDAAEQKKVKALSAAELQKLIAAVPEKHRLVVEMLAYTGLRIGELVALTWGDVDLGRKRVRVHRSYYRGTFSTTKTESGLRQVPLSDGLAQRLWKVQGPSDALVFHCRDGQVLNQGNYYNRVFKPAATTAGVPWATFHTLRHTCASLLFNGVKDEETGERSGGLNAKQVQAWLGHHSPSFTLERYVHLLEDDLAEAPAFFDTLLGGAPGGHQGAPRATETTGGDDGMERLADAVAAMPG